MKSLFLCVLLLSAVASGAKEIFIPQERIEVRTSHEDKPFSISGQPPMESEDAVSFLSYLCANWPLDEKPVLVIISETKANMPGEDNLHEKIRDLAKQYKLTVIHMPSPVGSVSYRQQEALFEVTKAWKVTNAKKAK